MKLVASLRSFASAIWRRSRVEDEMDEELRAHIRDRTDDLERSGISRAEAVRRARIEFGGYQRYAEECREALGTHFLETVLQDARFGLRMLRKNPGFTALAVLTLALGIAASTSIFTFVKATLLEPLPVRAGSRLVVIWVSNLKAGWNRIGPTGQDYLDWREKQLKSFEDLFLFEHGTGTVTGQGEPEQVAGLRVTTNFGDFFGIKPALGRTFRREEASARHNLIILSYQYWQRRFGSDPSVAGRGMTLNGEPYTIIGVLPSELSTLFPGDVVVSFDNDWLKRADSDLGVFGRLRPGVSLRQAAAEMGVVMRGMGLVRPNRKDFGAVLVPVESARVEYIRPALLVLLGAVGFVLLIACANVANLMMSRAIGRQREVAVRLALGAGRGRLLRQFLAESTLLALLGGCAGVLLALWSTRLLTWYVPSRIPVPNAADRVLLPTVHMDGIALAFALCISLLTGIAFGLAPAFQSLRSNVNESLKQRERGSLPGRGGRGSGAALVLVEGALAFVLVIGAALMLQSFSRLLASKPGFRTDHLLTVRIKLPDDAKDSKYRDPWQRAAAFQRFLSGVQAVPGVESAALAELVPLTQDDMDMGYFVVKEQPPLPTGEHLAADFRDISPGYFHTMGIPLIRGRAFTDHDNRDNPRVVLIDETLARHLFPNQDPIGKHVQIPDSLRPAREIVGVVGGVRDTGFDQQPRPTIYLPSLQSPDQTMSLVVRTASLPAAILPAIKNAIWSVDRDQPVFSVRSMDEIVWEITSAQRIAFLALDVFALLALVLAAVGIYGVTSCAVGQRTHEIGIRMALGARPRDVMRMIVGQGARMALLGVVIGLIGALGLTRLMSSLLYGVSATDPATFAAVTVLLVIVACLACYVPARRAMRVHPTVALRCE